MSRSTPETRRRQTQQDQVLRYGIVQPSRQITAVRHILFRKAKENPAGKRRRGGLRGRFRSSFVPVLQIFIHAVV
jgi:hypothetical protein